MSDHRYQHDDYTHPDVYQLGVAEGWAEGETDPTRINWAERQARAAIPFQVIGGRPVNPCERTAVRHGRNLMGFWGERLMADTAATATRNGRRVLLMVERDDGLGWALPGGSLEPGETPLEGALRELHEETGLRADPGRCQVTAPRYVPDPRSSDEAWAVTVLVLASLCDFGAGPLPLVSGGTDALSAAWVAAGSYRELAGEVAAAYGGQVFAAHVPMLRALLGTAS